MPLALRIVALTTFFLGLGLFAGTVGGTLWRWLHFGFGLATVILAAVVLGPWAYQAVASSAAGLPRGPMGWTWWLPVLPFVIGLTIFLRVWTGRGLMPVLIVHILLGIGAIGMIEVALGRARRAALATEQRQAAEELEERGG